MRAMDELYSCERPLLTEDGLVTDFAEGRHGKAHATFDCGRRHRLTLGRQWGPGGRIVSFCMLNPSTADAFKLDPTVTRCFNFAKGWGADGMLIVNIFSLRSTDPRGLSRCGQPNHSLNDQAILAAANMGFATVAAWGNHGSHLGRGGEVAAMLGGCGRRILRLGEPTGAGMPRHPLYVRGDVPVFPLFGDGGPYDSSRLSAW